MTLSTIEDKGGRAEITESLSVTFSGFNSCYCKHKTKCRREYTFQCLTDLSSESYVINSLKYQKVPLQTSVNVNKKGHQHHSKGRKCGSDQALGYYIISSATECRGDISSHKIRGHALISYHLCLLRLQTDIS